MGSPTRSSAIARSPTPDRPGSERSAPAVRAARERRLHRVQSHRRGAVSAGRRRAHWTSGVARSSRVPPRARRLRRQRPATATAAHWRRRHHYDAIVIRPCGSAEALRALVARTFAQVAHSGDSVSRPQVAPAIGPSTAPYSFDAREAHALTEYQVGQLVLVFAHGVRRIHAAGSTAPWDRARGPSRDATGGPREGRHADPQARDRGQRRRATHDRRVPRRRRLHRDPRIRAARFAAGGRGRRAVRPLAATEAQCGRHRADRTGDVGGYPRCHHPLHVHPRTVLSSTTSPSSSHAARPLPTTCPPGSRNTASRASLSETHRPCDGSCTQHLRVQVPRSRSDRARAVGNPPPTQRWRRAEGGIKGSGK